MAGCDLSVSNPGPVQDEFLDDTGAHPAVVAGAELNFIGGLNMVNFFGSEAAKEYTQGGRIHPTKLPPNPGQLDNDEQLPNNAWNDAHGARWIAEDAVRRLRETRDDFQSSELAAQALLLSGYANRLLGENMCEAVIDRSEVQPRSVHLERAEEFFTEAMTVASAAGRSDLANAAQAGRASVRLWLGENAGAAQDAAAVPRDFEYQAQFAPSPTGQNNWIHYISSNNPYRAHSVWNTFYEEYYLETGDPRVAWGTDPDQPTAEFENVPWYFQLKYPERTSPVNLSSGREVVLVRAEVLLRQGDWEQALDLINSLREGLVSDETGDPLPLWSASNATEAWTALKRERGIELWLETRRLGDLWRWVENDVPGAMEDVSDRIRLCFPVARSEIETNPSIPLDHESPTNPRFQGT
ncbi:MAG: RagB/SusD family nutrient uptake outer membrane protein [Gemmatimonadota bacterium]